MDYFTGLKRSSPVKQPTLIALQDCPLEINGLLFQPEKSNNIYYSFEMPYLPLSQSSKVNTEPLELQEINHEEIKQVNQLVSTMRRHEIKFPELLNPQWTFPINTLVIFIILGLIAIIWKAKRRFCEKPAASCTGVRIELPQAVIPENRKPLFSES